MRVRPCFRGIVVYVGKKTRNREFVAYRIAFPEAERTSLIPLAILERIRFPSPIDRVAGVSA